MAEKNDFITQHSVANQTNEDIGMYHPMPSYHINIYLCKTGLNSIDNNINNMLLQSYPNICSESSFIEEYTSTMQ